MRQSWGMIRLSPRVVKLVILADEQERNGSGMRNLRKSLIATVLIAMLSLAGIGSALAAQTTVDDVIISAGSRICIGPLYATTKVRADGSALAPGLRFLLQRRASPSAPYTTVAQSYTDTATGFGVDFNKNSSPLLFPGEFKFCARNVQETGVRLNYIILKTDGDAP